MLKVGGQEGQSRQPVPARGRGYSLRSHGLPLVRGQPPLRAVCLRGEEGRRLGQLGCSLWFVCVLSSGESDCTVTRSPSGGREQCIPLVPLLALRRAILCSHEAARGWYNHAQQAEEPYSEPGPCCGPRPSTHAAPSSLGSLPPALHTEYPRVAACQTVGLVGPADPRLRTTWAASHQTSWLPARWLVLS